MDSLLITELRKKGNKRSISHNRIQNDKSFVKKENSIYANNQLPKILEKSKEKFMNYMINDETKFANLDLIEEYYSNLKDRINSQYNLRVDLVNKKKNYIQEIDTKILNEVQSMNIQEYGGIISFYEKKMKNLNRLM